MNFTFLPSVSASWPHEGLAGVNDDN